MPNFTPSVLENGELAGSIRSKINSNFSAIAGTIRSIGFIWQGTYSNSIQYIKGDVVYYNSALYISKNGSIGIIPTNNSAWDFLLDGPINDGLSKEDVSNKSTSVLVDQSSDIKYPSVKSVYDWVVGAFSKYSGDADFYQYSIVTSVASGNLTVALKNYEGNDPTPTKPVKIQIGGVVRTITSACYINATIAGTNWGNAGSAELATKEIDWFVYILDYNNSGEVFNLGISRYPLYNNLSEATGGYTSEKYLIQAGNIGIENVVNIGRFNATLSAGAGYTWSIPATSVIINRPIYETRLMDYNSIVSASGSMTISSSVASINKYRIRGNTLEFFVSNTFTTGGTASNDVTASLPFNYGLDNLFSGIPCYDTADFISSGIISGSLIKVRKNNTTWTLGTGRVFGAQGFYNI